MSHNGNNVQVAPGAQGGVPLPDNIEPTPQLKSDKFDAGIAYALHTWRALTVAVQNHWGGSNGAEKRDWMAGAISDLFNDPATASNCDSDYVEAFILQIMNDEFEANIEDGTAFELAEDLCRLRKQCGEGDFSGVDALEVRFNERRGKDLVGKIEAKEEFEEAGSDDEVDDSEDDDDEDPDFMDVDRQPKPKKEKPPPEVDEDGFTTVRRK